MKKLIIPAMLATGLMMAQTTPPAQDPGQGQGQTKTTKKAKKSKKEKKDQTSTDSTTNK